MIDPATLAAEWQMPDLDARQLPVFAALAPHIAEFPARMRGPLARYLVCNLRPGDFLSALLSNDLYQACIRADDENSQLLRAYFHFLWLHAPALSWGSPQKFAAWLAIGEARRQQAEAPEAVAA